MAFKNMLSRFLLAIWNTLVALFTLKRARPYHSDDGKLEIVVHSPIVPEDASLSTCTGTASASSPLFSLFTKVHGRKGTEDDPLDESQTIAIKPQEKKKKFKKHTRTGARSDIPPPKIYVQDWSSLPFDVSNFYEPSKPDFDSWRPDLLPDSCLASSPLHVPTSQLVESSHPSKDQTDVVHSQVILKTTNPDGECPSPKPNDSVTNVHPIDPLPPIQLFSNDNYSFASSDSAYSNASPQLLTSPATSYIPNAILYDTPISSTLPSPICYKQTIARKKSQTQCSTVDSVESLSTSLFPSEPDSSVTTLGHEVSRTPYPDLFDFGMYVDIFGSGSDSFGSVVAGDGLSISGLEDKPMPRRHGVMFGTSVLGNTTTPSPRSPPLSKDVYRSAAYSKPVGSKKVVVGLGIGLENGGDGMRKAVLRGVVRRRSVSVSAGLKMSPSSPVLGRATSFDRGVRATSSVEEGLSVDAIEERLRDASWDKSMFDWSEAEFLEMLRHSP
ncbi:hypothetical protein PM082_015589 [Marasmius tenuissimus]|nr:hypothetical protein PM082_015589 [Marasmius tenuissimus]